MTGISFIRHITTRTQSAAVSFLRYAFPSHVVKYFLCIFQRFLTVVDCNPHRNEPKPMDISCIFCENSGDGTYSGHCLSADNRIIGITPFCMKIQQTANLRDILIAMLCFYVNRLISIVYFSFSFEHLFCGMIFSC